jgi:hypothetical protein
MNCPDTAKYAGFILNLLAQKMPSKVMYAPDEKEFLTATKAYYDLLSFTAACPEYIPLEDVPTRVPPVPKIKDQKIINGYFIMLRILYRMFDIPNHITPDGIASITYIPSPVFKRRMILEAHKVMVNLLL